MPDFFEGKPADISWYPPDTKEKGEALGNFFQTTGAPPKAAEKVPGLLKEIEKKHESIRHWGVVGVSWSLCYVRRGNDILTLRLVVLLGWKDRFPYHLHNINSIQGRA